MTAHDRAAFLAWNAANEKARRAYERDEGTATDYTAAERHAAANKRYRDRQRNTNKENA